MSVAALILAMQAARQGRQGQQADTEAVQKLVEQVTALADRPGRDGRDGRDGASIDRAVVRDGRLVLTRSTGDDIDVGPVTGPKGDRGEPGPKGESIVGPAGPAGRDGRDGEDGVGIATVERVKDSIVLTLDDGRTVDLGSFRGPAGPSGPRGPTGTAGTAGTGGGAAITVQDDGVTLTTEATSLNFTGAGVTATNSGGAVSVNIPSGGAPLAYVALKRVTPPGSDIFIHGVNTDIPWDTEDADASALWSSGAEIAIPDTAVTMDAYAAIATNDALSSGATLAVLGIDIQASGGASLRIIYAPYSGTNIGGVSAVGVYLPSGTGRKLVFTAQNISGVNRNFIAGGAGVTDLYNHCAARFYA
jgi:hypothetical protein